MVDSEQAQQFESVRTLVRYVDEEQAVIEIHTGLRRPLPTPSGQRQRFDHHLELLIELRSSDGFNDEQRLPLKLRHHRGATRLDVVRPKRWWPAGMGEQPLYDMTVRLLADDQVADERTATIGFTSVRPQGLAPKRDAEADRRMMLMVNGQECDIDAVVAIDQINENSLLPVAGDSLLLIRDHYGPDGLFPSNNLGDSPR